uniref:Uncharacterized protein n=1 Tax=Anguilla anguilla TaxID=7936 RepID=A0A0E9VV10_ANGAN
MFDTCLAFGEVLVGAIGCYSIFNRSFRPL